MSASRPMPSGQKDTSSDTYVWGTDDHVAAVFAERDAKGCAAFLTVHLVTGMRVLDCGCGSGSITCDLAAFVPPGYIVGIDKQAEAIEAARALAVERGVANVNFQTGDAYELPFPDGFFDAVYSNALLPHLDDPLKALTEMRRALRSGGVMGVRAADHDGHLFAPTEGAVGETRALIRELLCRKGTQLHIGRELRGLLHAAGLVNVKASAQYVIPYGEAGPSEAAGRYRRFFEPDGLLVQEGLVSVEKAAELIAELEAWGKSPDAFVAEAWCEAVGWAE